MFNHTYSSKYKAILIITHRSTSHSTKLFSFFFFFLLSLPIPHPLRDVPYSLIWKTHTPCVGTQLLPQLIILLTCLTSGLEQREREQILTVSDLKYSNFTLRNWGNNHTVGFRMYRAYYDYDWDKNMVSHQNSMSPF